MDGSVEIVAMYNRAIDAAAPVIAGIRPDQLHAPTPCSEWNVSALLDHLIGLQRTAAESVAYSVGGTAPEDGPVDPRSGYVASARATAEALGAPGALERTYRMPWAETQGRALATVLFLDTTVHTWDLARASGQAIALDPNLCETALAMGKAMMRPEFRTSESGFGPEVAISDDAPACDRLAAFYGRRPASGHTAA